MSSAYIKSGSVRNSHHDGRESVAFDYVCKTLVISSLQGRFCDKHYPAGTYRKWDSGMDFTLRSGVKPCAVANPNIFCS
jgi:hypothetical protein